MVKRALAAALASTLAGAEPASARNQPPDALTGDWTLTWPARPGSRNLLTVERATPVPGGASLTGRVIADDKEVCSVSGVVYERMAVPVQDGLDVRTVSLERLARLRVQCARGETWIEAFGLPDGPVLYVGRATVLAPDGRRGFQPVHLSR